MLIRLEMCLLIHPGITPHGIHTDVEQLAYVLLSEIIKSPLLQRIANVLE